MNLLSEYLPSGAVPASAPRRGRREADAGDDDEEVPESASALAAAASSKAAGSGEVVGSASSASSPSKPSSSSSPSGAKRARKRPRGDWVKHIADLERAFDAAAEKPTGDIHDDGSESEESAASVGVLGMLNRAGIHTVERVLATTDRQLIEASKSRWDEQDCAFIRQYLAKRSCTGALHLGDMLDHQAHFVHSITTGSAALDKVIGGGLFTEEITELVGASRCGKTQLCLSAAASLVTKFRVRAVYIDTCNSFHASRFETLCRASLDAASAETSDGSGSDEEEPLQRAMAGLSCAKAFDVPGLAAVLSAIIEQEERSVRAATQGPLRLLIVDSITNILAPILGGKHGSLAYAAMLRIAKMLRILSIRFGVAVLVVNSSVQDPGSVFFQSKPALGLSWAAVPNARILLFRSDVNSQGNTVESWKQGLRGVVLKSHRVASAYSPTQAVALF